MSTTYQAYFHQRWSHLTDPHVRNLAWLLDSPVLLNVHDQRWKQQLAEFDPVDAKTLAWLAELERNPDPLNRYLASHRYARLGRYAESILTFYFLWKGNLAAHNVQVQADTTIGEFDFLLNTPTGLQHWEFACKFYLLIAPHAKLSDYIGPNLTDNLGDKFHKMMTHQLALGQLPEAINYLPAPLTAAKVLLKGWLFYSSSNTQSLKEITPGHCRGLWCRLALLSKIDGDYFMVPPRFQWLAPVKVPSSQAVMSLDQLQAHLRELFIANPRPVLIERLVPDGDFFLESERIFVVPDEWG